MPKRKSTKKEDEFTVPKPDSAEAGRFLNSINHKNAHRVNREIVWLKDFDMYEVQFAGPQLSAIMDTFTFKHKESAQKCIDHASRLKPA